METKQKNRIGSLSRTTKETQVEIALNLDGTGEVQVDTGIGFFDHMLTLFGCHGRFDLKIKAVGDLEVDLHHTVEDVGLVLGEVFKKALGDGAGIRRYGFSVVPMDEALAQVALDLSGRPFLVFSVPFAGPSIGEFDTQLPQEFFRAFVNKAGATCHIQVPYGENDHHMIEAVFKAWGRALRQAASIDPDVRGIPSTKGVL
ncbi:imidazoleglycerol-phosphate dehydratase [Desulfatibacillum alkenivorans DSM 16219]|jgi:imidazoleglycerol-phosphate dehydratase|uniref:Imidazoleglycerol-phosphate dehydratase n=1 Tax=Desulfatibacillum alkenivorans DSM 16219 TaxID=1121393 RepID=A0A1M6X3E1_9BACT|nr:imidazoleglycerol-phosphate dehydratase HisB [Desulfatibacillum alkenivorans]SHL00458.1 imidazoleglycerol-phosphate dehydratase [Desulfatibacillum alkenivorans DSM 16219]